jgi:hypothetical protein
VEYENFYLEIYKLNEIAKVRKIDKFCDENKISKRALNKDFLNWQKDKTQKELKKLKKIRQKEYQDIFKLNDAITLPYGFSVSDYFLTYELKESATLYISKIFSISSQILAEDRAYFEIVKMEQGKKQNLLVSARDLIKNDRVAGIFADTGEIFDNEKAKYVTKFISEYIRLNDGIIEQRKGCLVTGWDKDNNFNLPSITNNIIWLDHQKQLEQRFIKAGDINKEIEMMNELAKGKVFTITLASLSPVINKFLAGGSKMNYCVHIGGLHGEGKSLAVKTGITLWGKADLNSYGRNFNATLNGLETYLHNMKDVPGWIDEMEAANGISDVTKLLYSYAEGTGKGRAFAKDGDVLDRDIKTFRGILFTTGEKNIDEIIRRSGEEGTNKKGGLSRRTLDLKIENLWNGINQYKIGKLLDLNYGNFSLTWIDFVDKNKEWLKKEWLKVEEEHKVNLDGKEKLFYSFFVVLSGLQKMNVITKEAFLIQKEFLKEEIKEELELRKITKNIYAQFIDDFLGFVSRNQANFYIEDEEYGLQPKIVYGKISYKYVCVINTVFVEFCTKHGYVLGQVINSLKRANALELDNSTGKSTKRMRLGKGTQPRAYFLKREILEAEEKIAEYSLKEDGSKIPLIREIISKETEEII